MQNSEQTALRNEYYEKQKARYGRDDWAKSSTNNAAYFVKLDSGDIVGIEKPKIKTRFCFSYGYCGVSTPEDYNNAEACAKHARTKQQYFIDENLKQLDYPDTTNHQDTWALQLGNGVARIVEGARYYNAKALQPLTENDLQRVADAYEVVKQAFIKRLNSYLKRYGLTKIDTWTYLSD